MLDRGFLIQFPEDAEAQTAAEKEPSFEALRITDLSSWFWSSIDNDDSRDLDQIEYTVREGDSIRVYVGIADVDWFVPLNSPLDQAAQHNTTSVYTGILTFPMLPELLSTDLSSLNEGVKRLAMITEMLVATDGEVLESSIYPAIVQNHAQLTYDAVAFWFETEQGSGTASRLSDISARVLQRIQGSADLRDQLVMQNEAAERLRLRRHQAGALSLETIELRPVLSSEGHVVDLATRQPTRASRLIEDFMIAANQVAASFLEKSRVPSIRRVVKDPERWDRIVVLAATQGYSLSAEPDASSLEGFLKEQHRKDPARFHELSLSVVKLLGRGEYVVQVPGSASTGHFGLAVQRYSHSTAPNRRYPDLLTQRLVKGVLTSKKSVYSVEQLEGFAERCTHKEDDANKVERQVKKCIAATVMRSHVGMKFSAIVTGAASKGTWVRIVHPPVEGKLEGDVRGLAVGDKIDVRLKHVDPYKGFIDFERLFTPS
jgi:exoribonuclease-2